MPNDARNTAPGPSAEARRLIEVLKECSGRAGAYHLCAADDAAADAHEERADRALSAYVAGLEAEVARLRGVIADCRPFVAHHDQNAIVGTVKPLLARIDAAVRRLANPPDSA